MTTQSDRTPVVLVLVLWLAGLCAAAQFAKISVSYATLETLYPQAGAGLGYVVSIISLFGVVFGSVAGILVASLGFRAMLLGALALGVLMSLVQAFLPVLPIFLLSRAVEGVSHLVIVVAAPTMIAQVTAKRHQAAALTLWGSFFGVAYAVMAWLGIPFLQRHGVPALYVAHAAVMAFTAALLFAMLPRIKTSAVRLPPLATLLRDHIRIFRSPFQNAAAIGWLFYTLTFVSLMTLLGRFVDPVHFALLITAMPLVSIASSLTLGVWLLRKIPAINVVMIGFAGAAGVMLALLAVQGSVVLFLVLAGFWGLIQGGSFAAVPQLNDNADARAEANGAMAQMGNLGNLVGTPILAAILLGQGVTIAVISLALVYAMAVAAHLWLRRLRG